MARIQGHVCQPLMPHLAKELDLPEMWTATSKCQPKRENYAACSDKIDPRWAALTQLTEDPDQAE